MSAHTYHKLNPFQASIKERYLLSRPGSRKKTCHLVLDLGDSGIIYHPGDSIGIFPQHGSDLLDRTLQALKATGRETVQIKQTGEVIALADFLTSKANLTDISPKLFKEVIARQTNSAKKNQLAELGHENHRESLKAYLAKHEVWDFLLANEEVRFTPQEIADLLMPLLPRFYSISSSQKIVGPEVHLTVAPIDFETNGNPRRGVCTHFLCHLAPLHTRSIPIFVQPSHGFSLPSDNHVSMIMVGPGTGVAPFRAFMQERILHHRSAGKHWLFFGECHRDYDFYYEQEWDTFAQQGHLRLETAFSRDQEHKVYVQHRMWERGRDIYQWLEEGAHIYVCGDAKRMAKDVENMLLAIVQEHGKKDPHQAKDYLKHLRQQKRYQRDVY